jgi:hypothetical protein
MKPIRIQRKRSNGWKMPENTMYVGRPTKWGNPIIINGDCIYIDVKYRRKMLSPGPFLTVGDISDVVYLFEKLMDGTVFQNADLQHWADHFKTLDLSELKGKNLACWCPLDKPCHADVLLKYANQ